MAELEEKANDAEKELARTVAGYADASRQVKWKDVQTGLKQAEAAIEFIHFKVNFPQKTDSTMYAALLLESGDAQAKFIPLFEEKQLHDLLNVTENISIKANALYSMRGAVPLSEKNQLSKNLFDLIWKPLEKYLKNVNTIYFSPSGELSKLNHLAIPIGKGKILSDKYNIVQVGSTRQLVVPQKVEINNQMAILYGGIQYEKDSSVILNVNSEICNSLIASRGELGFSKTDSTLRGGNWNYLVGTEHEVNDIVKIMQTSECNVDLKKGYDATEESFKNIGANNSASPRILHIATHGYFFPDPDRANSAKSGVAHDNATSDLSSRRHEGTAKAATIRSKVEFEIKEPVFKISEHPMLRSGLIMAGGNAAWQGIQTLEGREDGILTAYEISQMNLSNTELVVLSACETGLGDIQGNEGVYGLQRAFKIAGAKYLIMSLWQVPDKQTSLLMTTFYKKWLEEKMTIPNAFHAAQKEMREAGLDPYQWAGFVLIE